MRTPLLLDESGLVVLDATWGTIKPIEIADGVRTVGELELIEHLDRGGALIDSRAPGAWAAGTIPGARNLPHDDAAERIGDLDPEQAAIFFCNGPQCGASPDAIDLLLSAGHPASAMRYYRGGLHDWVSLGLPLEAGC
jgi:rhodanese-related sulfurtransferase